MFLEVVSKVVVNCNISTTSEWIIASGLQSYSKVRNAEPLDEREAMVTKGGPLYNGEVGLFKNAGSSGSYDFMVKDEVDEDAAEMVQQAVSAMEEAEKATGSVLRTSFSQGNWSPHT
jgi:hypothetical protein